MIELSDVTFTYPRGGNAEAGFTLHAEALSLSAGSMTAVVGPSGAGKTTLLHLIAGVLPATEGGITVAGHALHTLADSARRRFRLQHVGLVFQQVELLDYLDVRDNILLPLRLGGGRTLDRAARQRAQQLAERVGLSGKLNRPIANLSQGERQRVAFCRALITEPPLILADEPTSALDADTAALTMDLLFELAGERGATLVVLTHDPALLPRFDGVVRVEAGQVIAPNVEAAALGGQR